MPYRRDVDMFPRANSQIETLCYKKNCFATGTELFFIVALSNYKKFFNKLQTV